MGCFPTAGAVGYVPARASLIRVVYAGLKHANNWVE